MMRFRFLCELNTALLQFLNRDLEIVREQENSRIPRLKLALTQMKTAPRAIRPYHCPMVLGFRLDLEAQVLLVPVSGLLSVCDHDCD